MDNGPWIKLPINTHRISFSNVSPGRHSFKMKAADVRQESEIKEIRIHISPLWWETWWAKLIFAFLLLGISIFVVWQVYRRYKIKQQIIRHQHAEQINEAKLQFFTNISHEIRTPMSLIISPLQKLIGSDEDPKRQHLYHIIYRNSERILRLVNQLMDIRRIDKGQMSLTFCETDIVSFIHDLCDTFTYQANKNDITLVFNHEGIDTLNVWIDPVNFDKIILNILSNAFKFTPVKGKIEIFINIGTDNSPSATLHRYVEIIISDTGTGIKPDEIQRIFDRFYQIRNNSTNSNIGAGIGLHLTQSLVKLHHGIIHAQNNPDGVGCRFIVRLPLGCEHLRKEEIVRAEPPHKYETAKFIPVREIEEEKNGKVRYKYRLLIAEDDQEIRSYLKSELGNEYKVIVCNDGLEAWDEIIRFPPGLVITDVMMPNLDGIELCRKIKQNINFNHIPVVILTAKIREEDTIGGLEQGADAYITKPFNLEILKKTIGNMLSQSDRWRYTFSGKPQHDVYLDELDTKNHDDELMERIMKSVNQNLSNPDYTVDTLVRDVGISRGHLYRKLKELTTQSARDFIRNTRLRQGAKLLCRQGVDVQQVAYMVGFTHPTNFSTAFKILYGMTPKEYQQSQLNKLNSSN